MSADYTWEEWHYTSKDEWVRGDSYCNPERPGTGPLFRHIPRERLLTMRITEKQASGFSKTYRYATVVWTSISINGGIL